MEEEVGAKTISETYVEFNAGSSVTFSADVEIDAQELDRIVKTDYASYDFEVPLAAKQGQLNEDEAAAKAMGEFQFGEGAALCQDPGTGKYAAVRSMPLALLDVDSLSDAVDGIVALAAEWRTRHSSMV